ncbi:MAG: 5-methylcytosine restriction system specificity protein McrC [Lentisphaeria bacterium]|jgi:5-methylcytosine-specific restriction endonuclease McrBC regulatory subunit McrC
MIRLFDNRFGEHGQTFVRSADGDKYTFSGEDVLLEKDAFKLLDDFSGVTVKELQDESRGNLIVFARDDANLAKLPFYTLKENRKKPDQFNTLKENRKKPDQFNLDTGNLMGVLSLRQKDTSLKIQVRSRFDIGEKQYFLNYLLSRIFEVSFTELVSSSDDAFWDMLLAFVFLWRFSEAAAVGLYKQYHRFEYNDLNFRGRLDLDRHLKRNYPLFDRIAYSRREISFDNPLNHLLRHAAAKIEKKWPSMLEYNPNVRELLTLLKQNTPSWIPGDIQRALCHKDTLSELRHPYFAEYYEPLRRVSRMLLMDEGANVFDTPENSDESEISGVLFDGSWLWEEYLATVLCDSNLEGGPYLHADPDKQLNAIYAFKSGRGRLYPDFRRPVNDDASHCDIVLDAKYKRGDTVQSADRRQVLCYMFLTGATQGGLIFPPKTNPNDNDPDEDPEADAEDSNKAPKASTGAPQHCPKPAIINTPYKDNDNGECIWRCFSFLPLKTDADEVTFIEDMQKQEDALHNFAQSPKDFQQAAEK